MFSRRVVSNTKMRLTWTAGVIATQTSKVALILETEERKLARSKIEQMAFKKADSTKRVERIL